MTATVQIIRNREGAFFTGFKYTSLISRAQRRIEAQWTKPKPSEEGSCMCMIFTQGVTQQTLDDIACDATAVRVETLTITHTEQP